MRKMTPYLVRRPFWHRIDGYQQRGTGPDVPTIALPDDETMVMCLDGNPNDGTFVWAVGVTKPFVGFIHRTFIGEEVTP